jgi:hypothetical protein
VLGYRYVNVRNVLGGMSLVVAIDNCTPPTKQKAILHMIYSLLETSEYCAHPRGTCSLPLLACPNSSSRTGRLLPYWVFSLICSCIPFQDHSLRSSRSGLIQIPCFLSMRLTCKTQPLLFRYTGVDQTDIT